MLDWLFTPRCCACGGLSEDPMCEPCSASLEPLDSTASSPAPLDELVSPWRFGGQLAIAIRRLKFSGHT
nr:hypothetical protein [Deltaproteobacteria bacterium]